MLKKLVFEGSGDILKLTVDVVAFVECQGGFHGFAGVQVALALGSGARYAQVHGPPRVVER